MGTAFSNVLRRFFELALMWPSEGERQQTANLSSTLLGGHVVGV
jgi:hypothetical protein